MTGLGEGRGVIMRGGPPVLDDRVQECIMDQERCVFLYLMTGLGEGSGV